MKNNQQNHYSFLVTAGSVAGICIGAIVFLIGISIIGYRCYQRRRARNVQNRLSYAIKKGLKESANGRRSSSSVKSTPLKQHRATSPIMPPQDSLLDRSLEQGCNMPPEKGHGQSFPDQSFDENEKESVTTPSEKDISLRERQIDEKQRLGILYFSVEYDEQNTALLVTIVRASDLPPRDPSLGGCDPYIKLQLLPDKKHKCKTRVLRKTQHPAYDETFTFYGISKNQIPGITLHFVILSFDRFSRDEIIGEVVYPLTDVSTEQKELLLFKEINPRHLKVSQSLQKSIHPMHNAV